MKDLPIFQPGVPAEFNGIEVSYGVAPILNTIANLAHSRQKYYWTLYLINIETLIRNRKDNELEIERVARNVIDDCRVLAQYLAVYVKSMSTFTSKISALVCFYINKYENIPKAHIRDKLPKGTENRWRIRDKIYEIITKEGYAENYDNVSVLFSIAGTKTNTWPHRELATDLVNAFSGIQFRKTLMISHVPLDFHLYRVFNDFTILESYTGALKSPRDLGKKVFEDAALPFNKYLHLLLGDKWYLKSQVDVKTKHVLIKRALKEHWALIPDRDVLRSLVEMKLPNKDLYIKPDI